MCYNNDNGNHNEWTMINKRKKKTPSDQLWPPCGICYGGIIIQSTIFSPWSSAADFHAVCPKQKETEDKRNSEKLQRWPKDWFVIFVIHNIDHGLPGAFGGSSMIMVDRTNHYK